MKVFLETARLILFCFFINFCIVLKFGSLTLTLTKTPDRRPFVGVSLLILLEVQMKMHKSKKSSYQFYWTLGWKIFLDF
jgi:flagellar biosynthesis protein FliP